MIISNILKFVYNNTIWLFLKAAITKDAAIRQLYIWNKKPMSVWFTHNTKTHNKHGTFFPSSKQKQNCDNSVPEAH